mmetsp:Transcript_49152/g.74245  ORF Transcript_49152/g.74245 Transcript_49152/m.74245 type:complete len:228 (-) Transcript_49152:1268-1951(-)
MDPLALTHMEGHHNQAILLSMGGHRLHKVHLLNILMVDLVPLCQNQGTNRLTNPEGSLSMVPMGLCDHELKVSIPTEVPLHIILVVVHTPPLDQMDTSHPDKGMDHRLLIHPTIPHLLMVNFLHTHLLGEHQLLIPLNILLPQEINIVTQVTHHHTILVVEDQVVEDHQGWGPMAVVDTANTEVGQEVEVDHILHNHTEDLVDHRQCTITEDLLLPITGNTHMGQTV